MPSAAAAHCRPSSAATAAHPHLLAAGTLRTPRDAHVPAAATSAAVAAQVAERTITDDLEYLISHTVDPKKADYAGGG